MPRNQAGKAPHFLQNPNRQRKKSGKKYKKTIDEYLKLSERKEKEGETAWIQNALEKNRKKREKYGITQEMLEEAKKKKEQRRKEAA